MIRARGVKVTGAGGPEVLELAEFEVRDPGVGEVRVAVRAAGLNRADSLQRRGFYPAPKHVRPDVLGLEYAGEVEARGPGVELPVGARVMGIVAGAGMATHVVVHERELLPMPTSMSFEDAAALPEVFLTVFDALVVQGGMRPGKTVLLHAVGSGIGTAGVQLVAAYRATSIGTSRSATKLARALELGLHHGVHVVDAKFAEGVLAVAPRGADLVLDTIGAAYLAQNVAVVANAGCIVTIGLLGGSSGTLPLGGLLAKRARLVGSTLRARPLEEKISLATRAREELVPLFASGALRPVVDAVMPMSSIREAHARLDADDTFGKIVLHW